MLRIFRFMIVSSIHGPYARSVNTWRSSHCSIIAAFLQCCFMLSISGCSSPFADRDQTDLYLRQRVLPPSASTTQPDTPSANSISGSAESLPSGTLSLKDAIAIALRKNHTLQLSRTNESIAEQQVFISRSLFLPQITAGYGYDIRDRSVEQKFGSQTIPFAEKEFQRAELNVQMTVWDFGRSLGTYQQSQLGLDIAGLTLERVRQTVIYEVTQAYFNVLRAKKSRDIAAEALEQARSHLKTAQSLFANGVVDKNDVLRAEVHVAEIQQQLISADNAVTLSVSILNNILGINVNVPTEIEDVTDEPDYQIDLVDALKTAVDHRPEFELVQKAVRMEEAGWAVARSEHLPRIYVTGSLNYLDDKYQAHKTSALGEIGIQIDLFTGGRTTAQTRIAERRIRKAKENAVQICDGISLEVKQALLSLNDARERLNVAATSISQAEENLRLIENKYKQTAATPTDVVDAETLRSRTQASYYTALYDYIVAVERLRFAMGTNETMLLSWSEGIADDGKDEVSESSPKEAA